MKKVLVIVESPTKAKTINKFLGKNYIVKNSLGHIRDLPVSRFGVDIKNNFEPTYKIIKGKSKIVKELKKYVKQVGEIYIATDQDREGEAIGWHLVESICTSKEKIKRIVFHEITRQAIENAIKNPRQIDMHLVNAQQARRILDRIVGYKLSPLLSKKIKHGLSAGRVQSVTLRLIVEREREIEKFKPQEYWSIKAELNKFKIEESFDAVLVSKDGKNYDKLDITTKDQTDKIIEDLFGAVYQILEINKKEKKQKALPPFTTSTLQQEAWQKIFFSANKTMRVAQQLYEGLHSGEEDSEGLITYMRTDSLNVAESARKEAGDYIEKEYGKDYLPKKPPIYKTKAKGAQEAHEAIRPTSVFRTPEKLRKYLDDSQFKLYNLIWMRFVSSQMADAIVNSTTVNIQAKQYVFRAHGQTVKFMGCNKVYNDGSEKYTKKNMLKDNVSLLPVLLVGEELQLSRLLPEQHFTQPPPRYNEASLIKTLEKYGIGRPSTYAPTINTIMNRRYVKLIDRRFYPEEIGFTVNDVLVKNFPKIVDIDFTAQMENNLDKIASGKYEWIKLLKDFYKPFQEALDIAEKEIQKVKSVPKPTDKKCKLCGSVMLIKDGRFGEFIACSSFPACRYTEAILKKVGINCPLCDGEVVEHVNKRRRIFYGCSKYPDCKFISWDKPILKLCPFCGAKYLVEKKSKSGVFLNCVQQECKYQEEVNSIDKSEKDD